MLPEGEKGWLVLGRIPQNHGPPTGMLIGDQMLEEAGSLDAGGLRRATTGPNRWS